MAKPKDTLIDLSAFLGFTPQHIFATVASINSKYTVANIPKRSNPKKHRKLHIPASDLKGIQKSIYNKILREQPISPNAFAYVPGRCLVDAAQRLCGHKHVFKLDITNFFPSIGIRKVYDCFFNMGFGHKSAYILSKLCCYKGGLVQGAPTSPALSNIVCASMDHALSALAMAYHCEYTRYSDDLFFVSEKLVKPPEIFSRINKILNEHGFQLNKAKSRFYKKGNPRFTLGLQTSGSKPALSKETRRNYRAMFFKAARTPSWGIKNLTKLRGIAEWYRGVYGENETYLDFKDTIRTIEKTAFHSPYLGSGERTP